MEDREPTHARRIRWFHLVSCGIAVVAACSSTVAAAAESAARAVGLGQVLGAAYSGGLTAPASTPEAFGRTAEMQRLAAPTNQWYSSLLFGRWSQVLHAHPATYLAGAQGFEIGYPMRTAVAAGRHGRDIVYAHQPALTLVPTGFTPADARLAGRGDFSIRVSMADTAGQALSATLVHGSPFSYYTLSAGDLRVRLAPGAQRCAAPTAPEVLCVQTLGRAFALFAPPDAHWNTQDPFAPEVVFGSGGRFLSVALLPDQGTAQTLAEFQRHAYAFVTSTQVAWRYDPVTSRVETEFRASVEPRIPGADTAMLGVYPHQERALVATPAERFQFDSVRGPIQTVSANAFRTAYTYHGILPFWGPLEDSADRGQLASVLGGDAARARNLFSNQLGRGTYWYGKALAALAQLLCVAEQEGETAMRDSELKALRERLQAWLSGESHSNYFVQDRRLGTVVGYPEEYGSVAHMNDHHFHYGYWINAAAQVALRDREWSAADHWGGMVGLLASDIATADRDRGDFPFLRNFDAYEGHSWASGDAGSPEGNNQESSSEAVNAWAGLILWAAATGNQPLRDLGIWLYTTETEAISDYWFDTRHQLFPRDYDGRMVAAQVFGGRYAYNTWWTEEPRQIQGINLVPITPASIYLGRSPDYVRGFLAALDKEVAAFHGHGGDDGTPADIWQDIYAEDLALVDPAAALAAWRPRGSTELGETRSHTLYWMLSLKEMGTPDFAVTADTPLFGVFRQPDGRTTYLAYNAGDRPLTVTFSDGQILEAAAHALARVHAQRPAVGAGGS